MENVRIVYAERKTISIEVKRDGTVVVRAPFSMSEKKVLDLVKNKEKWIDKTKARLASLPEEKTFSPQEIEEKRKRAKKMLFPKCLFWSRVMGTTFGRITVTSARRRFGSCNSKGDLSFTLFLADYPEELVDYVVVHELSHTVHHNHSPQFYDFLSRFLPDWKERELRLRKIPLPQKTND